MGSATCGSVTSEATARRCHPRVGQAITAQGLNRDATVDRFFVMRHPIVLLLAACVVTARGAVRAQTPSGVYTEQQAVVGEAYFRGYCLECHGPADMANDTFKSKWHGRSVFDLFERLRTSMPDGAPGSLPRQTYADIVAYFLKLNGAPVGSMPLSADSLVLARTPLTLRAAATSSPSR